MARRSLKPQLNQIRAWVQQGRTDAWIAHQLEVSVTELQDFRKQHKLTADGQESSSQEMELRDEIEAEVEAATAEEAEQSEEAEEPDEEQGAEPDEEKAGEDEPDEERDDRETDDRGKRPGAGKQQKADDGERESSGNGGEGSRPRRRRRRGRRGGRGRRKELEATFDHGERDGYGLWLDASVKDNPVYAEHWAGRREVSVRIEPDQIVIRRAGANENDNSED